MAENNSSAPLLPCPFCGERTQINALGRRWWRMESGHRQDCLLSEVDHTVPQTDEQKQLLIDAWNTRAPQAVAAQAAPAAVAMPDAINALTEAMSVISSINRGTCAKIKVGDDVCYWQRKDWVDWAVKEVLPLIEAALAATPALPATEDSSAGDLAAVQAEPVATVKSWTSGSYHRNYQLEWHKDVPEGAQLFTAPQAQPADALDFEAAAKVMAERMDYPWDHMTERGRKHMRESAKKVIDAAMAAAQEGGNAAKEA